MKITAIIERNKENYFMISSDAEICECTFGGYGYSVKEAKNDFLKCIEEMREISLEEGKVFPGDLEVEFKYDIPSFFDFFDFINISKFAVRAGINESKMRQYKTGAAFASETTTKKIMDTINQIGVEFQAVRL